MSNKKIAIFIFCLALLAGFIYFVAVKNKSQANKGTLNSEPPQNETQNKNLESRMNDEGGVSIKVTPLNFETGKTISFQITFNTHQGDLDFDLMRQAVLIDNLGNNYLPLEWRGGSGGHHLSGILVFAPLPLGTKNIKLVVKDVYGIPERRFEWSLN